MHTIELATLALTIPGVFLSMLVMWHWYPATKKAFFKEKDATDWIILGVFIAFLGAIPDNVWWGIYWTLRSISSDAAPWWQNHGIFINLPFRQIALLMAAYCHVRAALMNKKKSIVTLDIITVAVLIFGILSACTIHSLYPM